MPKTKTDDKEFIKEGYKWHSRFHFMLGYRICEDEEDIKLLGITMKEILIEALQAKEKEIAILRQDLAKLVKLSSKYYDLNQSLKQQIKELDNKPKKVRKK